MPCVQHRFPQVLPRYLHRFGSLAPGLFPGFFSEFTELESSIGIHVFLHQMKLMHRNVYLFVPGVFEHHEFIL